MSGGRYESHYLRAVDPARPRGAWIRHTTHQRPGEPATGALWCTVWDAETGGPYAVKQSLPTPPPPAFARSEIRAVSARGEIRAVSARAGTPAISRRADFSAISGRADFSARAEARGRSAAWELSASGDAPALRHLPRAWMYRAPLPRTKLESPLPDAVFTGWIEAAGTRTEVAGWRGMVGHNWGAEHAERWVWLHALGFAEAPGAWLDVAIGRVRVGRALTPWVANGALAVDGRRYRLGGLRRPQVDARPGALTARLRGSGVDISVAVRAPDGQTVAFVYADPGGGQHHALNCSIAEVRLRVARPGRPALELAAAHGGAYELGVRPMDHGISVEPFPDP